MMCEGVSLQLFKCYSMLLQLLSGLNMLANSKQRMTITMLHYKGGHFIYSTFSSKEWISWMWEDKSPLPGTDHFINCIDARATGENIPFS